MVQFCCIIGCGNRSNRDNKRFFRLPNVSTTCKKTSYKAEITLRRRKQWLLNIRRADLKDGDAAYSAGYIRVCSDHFVSGKAAMWSDTENIDWAPTVNMGYNRRGRKRKDADKKILKKKRGQKSNTGLKRLQRARRLEQIQQLKDEEHLEKKELNLITEESENLIQEELPDKTAVQPDTDIDKAPNVNTGYNRRGRRRKNQNHKKIIRKKTCQKSNTELKKAQRVLTLKQTQALKEDSEDIVKEDSEDLTQKKLTLNPIIHKITAECIVESAKETEHACTTEQ